MRLVMLVGWLAAASPMSVTAAPPKDFKPLFNEKSLDGWHGWAIAEKGASPVDLGKLTAAERAAKFEAWTADAKKHWTVTGGELVGDGTGPALATEKEYGDIELLAEFKTAAKAESVISLRGSPVAHVGKLLPEWNTLRILQVGERTTVYLNGKVVVDFARVENTWDSKLPLPKVGKILLPALGGESRWRKLHVREIPAKEANDLLVTHANEGFDSVFNGKDFTGWDGPIDNYEVVENAIVCKPKKGGNIFTKAEFADHIVRLEYRLPPGGNNGLAMRYPGMGHVATLAMCELQILDDTDPKYAKLDPRQFNGSAYGTAAAHRGFLRPVGEWNFIEVTAKGSTLRAELNGTRILDIDMSKITEFQGNTPHPGKDRTKGHFGFAGHNDPVAFRNIRIKDIGDKK